MDFARMLAHWQLDWRAALASAIVLITICITHIARRDSKKANPQAPTPPGDQSVPDAEGSDKHAARPAKPHPSVSFEDDPPTAKSRLEQTVPEVAATPRGQHSTSAAAVEEPNRGSRNRTSPHVQATPTWTPQLRFLSGPREVLGRRFILSESKTCIGRTVQDGITVADPEVSSRHCVIEEFKEKEWTVQDLGSTNGTALLRHESEQQPLTTVDSSDGLPSSKKRHRLCHGDRVRLGSKVEFVIELESPTLSAGLAAPMLVHDFGSCADTNRKGMARGGRRNAVTGKYHMEDYVACLPPSATGMSSMGVFCVLDGHAGKLASEHASRLLPPAVMQACGKALMGCEIATGSLEHAAPPTDMANALAQTFVSVDARLSSHEYEGTTATAVVVWRDSSGDRWVQCANVGDSLAFLAQDDNIVALTCSHRLTTSSERARLKREGHTITPLQSRFEGISVTRALGDHFIKSNVSPGGLVANPHVSSPLRLSPDGPALIVLGSDGVWDALPVSKAVELVQGRLRSGESAAMAAEYLVDAAKKSIKCTDNVSAIVIECG